MEELNILREFIEQGKYNDALLYIDELEEMSKEDKLNKIYSYAEVLLIHLIKKQALGKTTRSWEVSIAHALKRIQRTNRRRKAGGGYAQPHELAEILADAFDLAVQRAALELRKRKLTEQEVRALINQEAILQEALHLISDLG
jgi:hypothetical protein